MAGKVSGGLSRRERTARARKLRAEAADLLARSSRITHTIGALDAERAQLLAQVNFKRYLADQLDAPGDLS